MATIQPLSRTQSAAPSGSQQFRLQQAKTGVKQAEQTARSMLTEASEARQVARQAEGNARYAGIRSEQAQASAGQARQGLAAIEALSQMQTQVGSLVTPATNNRKTAEPVPSLRSAAPPATNALGQVTGTLINTTA